MSGRRRAAVVVPARLGSTRLPKKALLSETGFPLIQHVVENVRRCRFVDRIVVATDSEEIAAAVRSFGGEALLTSPEHRSGSDRVAEAAQRLDHSHVVNVQGDEPDLDPDDLARLVETLLETDGEMVTLAVRIEDEATWRAPHAVKVVTDASGRALAFSRAPIPWGESFEAVREAGLAWKHVGVYGFPRETLLRFARLERPAIERLERLEQWRALHHGIPIRVVEARHDPIGIDTEDDYRRFVARRRAQESER